MLRNLMFIDFGIELKRILFNSNILDTYDLILKYIKERSNYGFEFWKSIWIKNVNSNNMVLLLLDNKVDKNIIEDELCKLNENINVFSLYYQLCNGKKKPNKLENIFLFKGHKTIKEQLGNFCFNITPYSFNQSNTTKAFQFYSEISDIICRNKNNYKNLVVYGRTASPISLFNNKNFEKIFCFIPCHVVYNNMIIDLDENNIKNVMVTVDDNKGNFYPSNGVISQKFLLLLSPGYQGLSKNLLDNIIEDKNVKDVFLLYCNENKLNKDTDYIFKKRSFEMLSINTFELFPNTKYKELFVHIKF